MKPNIPPPSLIIMDVRLPDDVVNCIVIRLVNNEEVPAIQKATKVAYSTIYRIRPNLDPLRHSLHCSNCYSQAPKTASVIPRRGKQFPRASASHRFPFLAKSGLEGELTWDHEANYKVLKDGSGFVRVIKVLNSTRSAL